MNTKFDPFANDDDEKDEDDDRFTDAPMTPMTDSATCSTNPTPVQKSVEKAEKKDFHKGLSKDEV